MYIRIYIHIKHRQNTHINIMYDRFEKHRKLNWVLMGRTLMAAWGPHGPGSNGPPWALWAGPFLLALVIDVSVL